MGVNGFSVPQKTLLAGVGSSRPIASKVRYPSYLINIKYSYIFGYPKLRAF